MPHCCGSWPTGSRSSALHPGVGDAGPEKPTEEVAKARPLYGDPMLHAELRPVFAQKACRNRPLTKVVVLAAQQRSSLAPQMRSHSTKRVQSAPAYAHVRADSRTSAQLLRLAVVQQREWRPQFGVARRIVMRSA